MHNDTLIICTRNRHEDLALTLASLKLQSLLPTEIVFVDSSDNGLTKSLVSDFAGECSSKVKYFSTRPGLTFQRNFGIKESSGEVIHFIDDDVDLDRDYFLEINKVFNENPSAFAVGGKLLNKTTAIDKLIRRIFMLSSTDGNGKMKRSGFPDFQWENSSVRDITMTSILVGCSCSYRRTVFDELSFDEYFQGYGFMEDEDFSFSVSKKFSCYYNANAKLFHRITTKSRTDLFRLYKMMNLNHTYVFNKHVRMGVVNLICFVIAKSGLLLQATKASMSNRSFTAVRGFFAGCIKA